VSTPVRRPLLPRAFRPSPPANANPPPTISPTPLPISAHLDPGPCDSACDDAAEGHTAQGETGDESPLDLDQGMLGPVLWRGRPRLRVVPRRASRGVHVGGRGRCADVRGLARTGLLFFRPITTISSAPSGPRCVVGRGKSPGFSSGSSLKPLGSTNESGLLAV
jgi:hypothetical protein